MSHDDPGSFPWVVWADLAPISPKVVFLRLRPTFNTTLKNYPFGPMRNAHFGHRHSEVWAVHLRSGPPRSWASRQSAWNALRACVRTDGGGSTKKKRLYVKNAMLQARFHEAFVKVGWKWACAINSTCAFSFEKGELKAGFPMLKGRQK